jgi:two-component system phosphate regulon sensor histidine kinase PhoR
VLLAPSLAGPLGELMDAARRLAAGDLESRIRTSRKDELGELARMLDESAERLQQRLELLGRERARSEAILASMEDGLLALDHRGSVGLANEALLASLGLDQPVGRHYLEAIREPELGELIEAVLKTGARQERELEIRHLRRSFGVTGVAYPGDAGAPHGAVLTFHDVTERHRLERMRRDFVANASHELRTPLTAIRGFVEALEDGALEDPQTAARFLARIRMHADRIAALVDALLELSRLEAGEHPLLLESVEPGPLAEEVLASFRGPAERRGVELLARDVGAGALVTDPERLRRILENLVDNAVKYTQPGGHIEVRTLPLPDGGVRVDVRDDGPGISSEHLPRLFERFYRADKARSRESGGTGLGLAIVKHLAEPMGAAVSVESSPGSGSCFSVTLPAVPPAATHPASE